MANAIHVLDGVCGYDRDVKVRNLGVALRAISAGSKTKEGITKVSLRDLKKPLDSQCTRMVLSFLVE